MVQKTKIQQLIRKAKRVVRQITAFVRQHVSRRHLYLTGGAFAALTLLYTIALYWPRTTNFSYAHDTCVTNPILLPGLFDSKRSQSFSADLENDLSLSHFPLYSHKTCITPLQAPKADQVETIALSLGGNGLLAKKIRILPDERPVLGRQAESDAPVPTNGTLDFTLESEDKIFDYQLYANDHEVACTKQNRLLACETSQLKLKQSAHYDFELHRMFQGTRDEIVFAEKLATVQNVRIMKSSIASKQTVYNAPKDMTLTLNRRAESITSADLYRVDGKERERLPVTASVKNKTVTIAFDKPLPRSATLQLKIRSIVAADKGRLDKPFSLQFRTSGGPKVLGVYIGGSKMWPTGSITLTFDSNLSAKQNAGSFIGLNSGNRRLAANISVRGRTVTLTPQSALPRCSSFSIVISEGLQNEFGITGNTAWQYNGQVYCQQVFSIGTSVLGRGITAYSFGSGASKIIFVGTTHGDEKSSTYLLNSWVAHLENNAHRIPSDKTVIVIPNLNPDGFAADTRTNARNVDLNRNFPANNWKRGVTMPDLTYNPNGGGTAPLSEPESKALANYVLGQAPKLVLTYHSAGGVVIPNGSGNSQSRAHTYAQNSSVNFMSNSQTGTFFPYDTTGAFEDWLHDKPGIPALLIELWTHSSNEFSGHVNAMWSMLQ